MAWLTLLILLLSTSGSAQTVTLGGAYRTPRTLTYQLLDAQGVPTGVLEDTTLVRVSSTAIVLQRVYHRGATCPTTCPRIEDRFEWRGSELLYHSTRDYYSGHATDYPEGHWWLTDPETLGLATHRATTRVFRSLPVGQCDAAPGPITWTGTAEIWHAVYAVITHSPYYGSRKGWRLDEVTLFEGNSADVWREEWFFVKDAALGMIPVGSAGYRQTPGGTLQWLWRQVLIGIRV